MARLVPIIDDDDNTQGCLILPDLEPPPRPVFNLAEYIAQMPEI